MPSVAAFYRFAPLPEPAARRAPLLYRATAGGVRGSVLLAPEGVNGTVAGPREAVEAVVGHIRAWPGFEGMRVRWSRAETMPFGRLKVRLKREIVTMGAPGLGSPEPGGAGHRAGPGRYVVAADWNAVLRDPDTVTIDTRNAYEVAIGSFAGAVDPGTAAFGDFPAWWRAQGDRFAGKRIAMFCTGGIRCEKATAFLRGAGVADVVHLEGGILSYLAETPEAESLWRGGCFVFDDRVALGHGLTPTGHRLCHGCRHPLRPGDEVDPRYEAGVACPRCAARQTDVETARHRERRRQVEIAAARGHRHLGPTGAA